jgi:DNA-binding transcriptional LysR family regulator
MGPRVDLKDLSFIATLAQMESVKLAAERLGCVQSNVSNRIKRLEQDLNLVLFTRSGGRMVASPAAEAIASAAPLIEAMVHDVIVEAKYRSLGKAIIRIGVMESFAATHLAAIIGGFPGVEVFPFTGPSVEIASRVRRNHLDFGVVAHVVQTSELQIEALFEQQFMIATAHGKPENTIDRVAALRGVDPLLRSQIIEIVARRSGRIPTVIELGSLDAIISVVKSGFACAVLPSSYLGSIQDEDLAVSPISRAQFSQLINCIRNSENNMDTAWDTLLTLLQKFDRFPKHFPKT